MYLCWSSQSCKEKSSKLISANLFQKVTIKTFNYLLLLLVYMHTSGFLVCYCLIMFLRKRYNVFLHCWMCFQYFSFWAFREKFISTVASTPSKQTSMSGADPNADKVYTCLHELTLSCKTVSVLGCREKKGQKRTFFPIISPKHLHPKALTIC